MNPKHVTIGGIALFFLGIVFGLVVASTGANVTGAAIDTPATFSSSGSERMPADRISEDQIIVRSDDVVLRISDASWSRFTDTNSMTPFLDEGANAIHVTPRYPEELQEGDIVSYRFGSITLIHRIIETGYDRNGWYAIVKGDSNAFPDPIKVRFDQIERVLVAIVY